MLIEQEESSLAASTREAQGLSFELKDDIGALRDLRSQLVGGNDREDEALIAGTDRVRMEAIAVIQDCFH